MIDHASFPAALVKMHARSVACPERQPAPRRDRPAKRMYSDADAWKTV